MYRRKFDNLNRKIALKKEKALDAARKSQIEFYVELTKELYKSNKLDCSRESDKCRRNVLVTWQTNCGNRSFVFI
jgi:hypothetical protein